jgi:hypothetical protein
MALALGLAGQACAGEPATLARNQSGTPAIEGIERVPIAPAPVAREHGNTISIGGEQVQAVDLDKLEHERGRADTVLNDTKLNGDVARNSAVNVNTGSNTIDAGSFANMSGIPVVIQNSGANVLIQNATVVNLQFR